MVVEACLQFSKPNLLHWLVRVNGNEQRRCAGRKTRRETDGPGVDMGTQLECR